ncbi:acyltransferase family protein [Maricaulis sp. MIT060901]|uniref:acyltransferase family protein n=1 Tax=Maricaulis sp. MIT060901 TaxID=3096993 RepID=UPI00399A06BC
MSSTNLAQSRHGGIDTLRGLACILLLVLHVVGEQATNGLRVPDDHPLAMFTAVFFHLRMPLFAMLSGFVYAYRPPTREVSGQFVTGKMRRVGLPFLFVTTIYGVANTLLGAGYGVPWGEFWQIYVSAYAYLWFLQAVLILFLVIGALDLIFPKARLQVATGFLAVTSALFLSDIGRGIEWMSFDRTLYLAPFFALGVFLNRFEGEATRGVKTAFLSSMALLGTIHFIGVFADPSAVIERRDAMALGLGLTASGSLILFRNVLNFAPLAWIGRFSFGIYLYHMFPVMALLAVYKIMGFPDPWLGLVIGATAGLTLSIAAEIIARSLGPVMPWLPALTLGLKVSGKEKRRHETAPASV